MNGNPAMGRDSRTRIGPFDRAYLNAARSLPRDDWRTAALSIARR
jgi:hypothetical protein